MNLKSTQSLLKIHCILAMLIFCASCSQEEQLTAHSEILARVNGEEITVEDLDKEVERLQANSRPVPPMQDLLDQLIDFKIQVQKAQSIGIPEDSDIKRQIDKMLVTALRERELKASQELVDEAKLRAIYEANQEKYTTPASDRFAVLFLELDKHASEAKRTAVLVRIEEARVLAEKQSKTSVQGFGDLSQTHSEDQLSRYRGGDIGWCHRTTPTTRIPENVWQEGVTLDKGQVSNVIESEEGLYLVKKTDFRPSSMIPFEKVKASIQRTVLSDQRNKVEIEFISACRAWADLERNDVRIAQLQEKTLPNEERRTNFLKQANPPKL